MWGELLTVGGCSQGGTESPRPPLGTQGLASVWPCFMILGLLFNPLGLHFLICKVVMVIVPAL